MCVRACVRACVCVIVVVCVVMCECTYLHTYVLYTYVHMYMKPFFICMYVRIQVTILGRWLFIQVPLYYTGDHPREVAIHTGPTVPYR